MSVVARVSQRYIRSIIEEIWEQAPETADSFLEALKACRRGKWEKTSTGWLVSSSSGVGHSTSFHIPMSPSDSSAITPVILQEVIQNIIENYRIVKASGIAEDVGGSFDDSAFGAALVSLFPTLGPPANNWMYLAP